ncbi:MAG: ATP-binding protein [Pseudomonadota bacterium]
MRPRLVHTLSLSLVLTALLAVVAMGGVLALNLRNGFGDYLAMRDVERLETLTRLVNQAVQQAGSLPAWLADGPELRQMVRETARIDGRPEGRPEGPKPCRPPSRDCSLPAGDRPPPPGGPGGGPDAFGRRLALMSLDERMLAGAPHLTGIAIAPGVTQRPVQVSGQTVAWLRLLPVRPVPESVDARFLQAQYRGIVVVAVVLIGLSLGGGWWLARRWVRPLASVQAATARIAQGDFHVRLPSGPKAIGSHDEVGEVVHNINQMAEGLERLDGSRRRWIADISHELRTPLTVLRGEIEALVDGVRALDPPALLSLRDEVLRLGTLVDDLHLLAMSELQRLPCDFTALDAVELVRGVLRRFDARAAAAEVALDFDPGEQGALTVRWDAMRIEQLLANLLENSLRYTDAPGGRIRVRLACVANEVQLDVDDTPPGVAPAELPRLFEPLYRADTTRSRCSGGSGLGLAICQLIVQAHGGRMAAAASELGGLQVRITLPVNAPSPPASAPTP